MGAAGFQWERAPLNIITNSYEEDFRVGFDKDYCVKSFQSFIISVLYLCCKLMR